MRANCRTKGCQVWWHPHDTLSQDIKCDTSEQIDGTMQQQSKQFHEEQCQKNVCWWGCKMTKEMWKVHWSEGRFAKIEHFVWFIHLHVCFSCAQKQAEDFFIDLSLGAHDEAEEILWTCSFVHVVLCGTIEILVKIWMFLNWIASWSSKFIPSLAKKKSNNQFPKRDFCMLKPIKNDSEVEQTTCLLSIALEAKCHHFFMFQNTQWKCTETIMLTHVCLWQQNAKTTQWHKASNWSLAHDIKGMSENDLTTSKTTKLSRFCQTIKLQIQDGVKCTATEGNKRKSSVFLNPRHMSIKCKITTENWTAHTLDAHLGRW